ncbi:MAG TPA: hypothetical protein VFV51_10510 [Vicinamibacterales bacterium]|nr:hypothetical protein [Vicinamibacterales bacterium]
MRCGVAVAVIGFFVAAAAAQTPQRQTQEDDYTRYELLGPDTAQFRILYEVTGTTAGAPFFFNAIRKGSIATDERVTDMMTGQPLKWEIVSGAQARKEGHPTADLDTEWLKVHLARPIPKGGEARVLIDKTYKDPKSYYRDGDTIVFDRSLGIKRNAVVLPVGYRLVSCNVPSQVMTTPDGRVMITFMNPSPAAAPLVIRARPGLAAFTPKASTTRGPQIATALASQAARLSDRAHQDREIVYFPNDPATNSFALYHDYTESRPGVGHYFNVVRAGSSVSNPSAVLLDTGEPLKVETVSGAELKKRGLDAGEPVTDTTQIVVISFPPIKNGQSARLRITETYTDPGRYFVDGDELVWDRAFGRPRNSVVLPAGWTVVASSIPGTISHDADGRQRLYFENNRNDEIQVLIRARRFQP